MCISLFQKKNIKKTLLFLCFTSIIEKKEKRKEITGKYTEKKNEITDIERRRKKIYILYL
jgi:hypothetical protein